MILDHLFEDVPHHRVLLFDQLFGLLDGRAVAALLEPMIDERLEQLERHLFRETALMQLEVGTDDDDGTAGVVDALAEEVLAETALLTLEGVGERFERAVVRPAQHAAAAAVVEQSVDGLLKHALFVADDHVRRVQLDQLFQPVVSVDDATVEVVEVGRGEAAAIERHQGTQLRRNDRDHVEDHPLGLVARLAEGLDDAQALGVLELLLDRRLGLHLLPDLFRERFDVDLLQQFLDALGAHHRDVFAGEFLVELPLSLVGDNLALADAFDFTGGHDDVGFEVQDALELAERDVEEVPDAARKALEEPDVGTGARQLDVPEALAADAGEGHFDAALVADDAPVLHAFVLSAQAFPILGGSEDARAEQPVALRLKSPVINSLRLGHFAVGPAPDLFRRSQRNTDGIKIRD